MHSYYDQLLNFITEYINFKLEKYHNIQKIKLQVKSTYSYFPEKEECSFIHEMRSL